MWTCIIFAIEVYVHKHLGNYFLHILDSILRCLLNESKNLLWYQTSEFLFKFSNHKLEISEETFKVLFNLHWVYQQIPWIRFIPPLPLIIYRQIIKNPIQKWIRFKRKIDPVCLTVSFTKSYYKGIRDFKGSLDLWWN